MHIFLENVRYSVMRASVCSPPDWSKIIIMGDLYFYWPKLCSLLSVSESIKNISKSVFCSNIFHYVLCLIDIL